MASPNHQLAEIIIGRLLEQQLVLVSSDIEKQKLINRLAEGTLGDSEWRRLFEKVIDMRERAGSHE